MLTLTEAPRSPFRTPITVPVGSGLAAQIPEGPGRPSVRWHERAQHMRQRLSQLYEEHGSALEYRRLDQGWLEVRVIEHALPVGSLLTHPSLAAILTEALELHLGEPAAVYYKQGRILACPASHADMRQGWIGPMDLSAGYCMALPLK